MDSIREQYEQALEPKMQVILNGSAHGQLIFDTDQGWLKLVLHPGQGLSPRSRIRFEWCHIPLEITKLLIWHFTSN
ncbi:MAG: hypothetical protein ACRDFQ_05205 [Anaerolineales bacterium]